MVTRNSSISTN